MIFLPGLLLIYGMLPFWDGFRRQPMAQAMLAGFRLPWRGDATLRLAVFSAGCIRSLLPNLRAPDSLRPE
jgi:hypothetical protein